MAKENKEDTEDQRNFFGSNYFLQERPILRNQNRRTVSRALAEDCSVFSRSDYPSRASKTAVFADKYHNSDFLSATKIKEICREFTRAWPKVQAPPSGCIVGPLGFQLKEIGALFYFMIP